MGSAESAEARRVSFEMDEEERVRVLQGIRLSESVVNRMKDCSQPSAGEQLVPGFGPSSSAPVPTVPLPAISVPTVPAPTTPVPTAPSSSVRGLPGGTCKGPLTDVKVPSAESGGGLQSSAVKEDLKKFQQEQLAVQDEMVRVAKKEKEAAEKHLKASLPKKKASLTHEQQQSARLARELEDREAELSRCDTFYKEQQGRIQEKNAELYKLSSQQFHEAASKAESTIKPRRVEPVCSGLQAQILRCYRDHLHEVLLCSDLVKAYQHCVSTARKG
ncbi:coiled-coil-helix-coiled-coil-helix domain containing 6, isoform CRA_b [Mus musculus]|nr:Coiled-coil-helix-coiled-coil-helix domain containing 6 [Mus musculus]AAH52929.1 Coiled-coil-helix-coiled-coil-helix domain containing 6 [Mus musculus]EDK99268.1 coiled-coil-helix-coiled-coil-helix domain containing 6, isoform CRA_b [Mus musculus]